MFSPPSRGGKVTAFPPLCLCPRPDPHFMSTTLVTLTQYVTAHMYDDLAANSLLPEPIKAKLPSSEVCRTAYRVGQLFAAPVFSLQVLMKGLRCLLTTVVAVSWQVNVGFLCVQYGILAVACLILVLCTYALLHRPLCSPHRPPPPPLRASSLHPVLACLAFCSMLVMLVCKEVVATTAVRVAQATGHSPMYQFTDNNLDMISLTTLITIGTSDYTRVQASCDFELAEVSSCGRCGGVWAVQARLRAHQGLRRCGPAARHQVSEEGTSSPCLS